MENGCFDIDTLMDIAHSTLLCSSRKTGVMAFVTDMEGIITHHCASASQMTGYQDGLKGLNFALDLIAPQYRDYFTSLHPSKTFKENEIALEGVGLLTKDHELLFCRAFIVTLYRYPTNEHRGYHFWLRDVSHLHRQKTVIIQQDNLTSEKNGAEFELTPRELIILKCAAQGMSLKMTADDMGISTGTVSTHRRNIKKKIGPSVENLRFQQIAQRYKTLL